VWRFGGWGWGRGEGCGIAALTAWLESRERCRDGKGDGCITRRVGNSSLRRGRESCRGDRIMVIRSYLNGPHHDSSFRHSPLLSCSLLVISYPYTIHIVGPVSGLKIVRKDRWVGLNLSIVQEK